MEDLSVDDVHQLMSCSDCYAVVKTDDLDKHFEWHERAVRDAVAASVVVVSELPKEAPGREG
jgi:hypothetical protein